ncbi:MAG: OmpA family protein [Candidatus Sedimenticola endophacoides]
MLKVAVSPIRERGQISLGVGLILTLLTLTSGGAIYHYQNQTIKLSRQLDDLQRDRAEARGEQQRRDGLLQERERELEMVRGERQRDAETIASLRQNGDAMEQRAEAAEQLLSREQTALTGLRQQLAATREQMEQTLLQQREEREQIEKTLQQQRDERQRVKLSLQQGRDELSRITREQARLSEQKRTLEDQLTQGGEVNRGLREENRELRERLAQLQTQLEALNLDQEQLQQLQEHLARERSRVRQLHDRTADLQESNQSLKQRLDQVNQTLEKELSARQMTIKCFQQRLEIILLDSMLYPSGSARLSPQGRNALRQLAPLLRQSAPRVIQVSGHTDNRPFRQDVTSPYSNNWALSSARATEVVRYLIGEGVEAERLVALGHADTRPVGDNETPEGRSQNRRIEIFVRGGDEG